MDSASIRTVNSALLASGTSIAATASSPSPDGSTAPTAGDSCATRPVHADASRRVHLSTIAIACSVTAVTLILAALLAYVWRRGQAQKRRHAAAERMTESSGATLVDVWLEGARNAQPPDDLDDDAQSTRSSRPSWIASDADTSWRRLAKRAKAGSILSTPSFVRRKSSPRLIWRPSSPPRD